MKNLYGVENKSIASSIKKFSTMSREDMEKLSETEDLRYLLGVMNSKYASVLLTNLRSGDYHSYPEHIRNIPIPSATLPSKSLSSLWWTKSSPQKSQSAGRYKQRRSRNRPYKHTHLLCLYVRVLWPFRRRDYDCGGEVEEIIPFL